jgi:hypothetical protein
MNIASLNEGARRRLLGKIADGLKESLAHLGDDTIHDLLVDITASLDTLDGFDAFGTEGWKYLFEVRS